MTELVLNATKDFLLEIAKGTVAKHSIFHGFGERPNVAIVTTGEDIWQGATSAIPVPPVIGEQMTVVSDSVDDNATGIGAQTVSIHYLDGNGLEQIENITMNGVTPVNTVATDISFVNAIHTYSSGSNGVAVGNITIYKLGSPATVYNMIGAGGNMSLTAARKVPSNKTFYLKYWGASVAAGGGGAKPTAIRLRSTDQGGELITDTFIFKDSIYLEASPITSTNLLAFKIPSNSIIKVSAWTDIANSQISANFTGIMVED